MFIRPSIFANSSRLPPRFPDRSRGGAQVPSSFGLDEDSQGLPLETPDLIQQTITVGHLLVVERLFRS